MTTFLPENYEQPSSEGNYFKFKLGENRFRILSSAIVGWEYWTKSNKPVRSQKPWDSAPDEAKKDEETGRFQKHFWCFVVWNYDAKKAQIMEITQTTIQNAIGAYVDNSKWGDPKAYDFLIEAKGDGLEREYTVIAEPHTPAPKVDISQINLKALFLGEDPFTSKAVSQENDVNP